MSYLIAFISDFMQKQIEHEICKQESKFGLFLFLFHSQTIVKNVSKTELQVYQ